MYKMSLKTFTIPEYHKTQTSAKVDLTLNEKAEPILRLIASFKVLNAQK